MINLELYEKIKARRLDLGLTLEDVGNIVGVGKSTVRKWETGNIADMKRDKIALLAKALNVSPLFIMGIDEEEPQPAISEKENILLSYYNQLNDFGKQEAIKRVSELTEIPKYSYEREYEPETIAAHADELTEEENSNNLKMVKKFMRNRNKL